MSLLPRWYHRLPFGKGGNKNWVNKWLDEMDQALELATSHPTGLTISSDDEHLYVEAHVPGLTSKDVNVSLDEDNVLWIKGEKEEEERDKKREFFRKAVNSFSYCIPLGEEINIDSSVNSWMKDGVIHLKFEKRREKQKRSKKIEIQQEN